MFEFIARMGCECVVLCETEQDFEKAPLSESGFAGWSGAPIKLMRVRSSFSELYGGGDQG